MQLACVQVASSLDTSKPSIMDEVTAYHRCATNPNFHPAESNAIPGSKNKQIHLVRHAQGFHNLKFKNHSMSDPLLTPKGIAQCKDLSTSFPAECSSAIELLVVSPLRRTIYTALHGFPEVIKRGTPIIALPEAQETGAGLKPCDTGSNREILEDEFKEYRIDFTLLHDGWNPKLDTPDSPDKLRERASFVRTWLRDRSEQVICLVCHGGFLHYLTEDWEGFQEKKGTGWRNCEWRTYEFKDGTDPDDDNASLVETENSRAKRSVA